jgi:hypothetical protein
MANAFQENSAIGSSYFGRSIAIFKSHLRLPRINILLLSDFAKMSTMKAVWVDGATKTLKELPIPDPGDGQVLIKAVCAAQNPKDWKSSTPKNFSSDTVY